MISESHVIKHPLTDAEKNDLMVDRFYINKPNKVVYWNYYNPDSNAGGQIVYNTVTFDQILESETFDSTAFFENLESAARQELLDVDQTRFKDAAEEILLGKADLLHRNKATMTALLTVSKSMLN